MQSNEKISPKINPADALVGIVVAAAMAGGIGASYTTAQDNAALIRTALADGNQRISVQMPGNRWELLNGITPAKRAEVETYMSDIRSGFINTRIATADGMSCEGPVSITQLRWALTPTTTNTSAIAKTTTDIDELATLCRLTEGEVKAMKTKLSAAMIPSAEASGPFAVVGRIAEETREIT